MKDIEVGLENRLQIDLLFLQNGAEISIFSQTDFH
jgi:hypothetical protein